MSCCTRVLVCVCLVQKTARSRSTATRRWTARLRRPIIPVSTHATSAVTIFSTAPTRRGCSSLFRSSTSTESRRGTQASASVASTVGLSVFPFLSFFGGLPLLECYRVDYTSPGRRPSSPLSWVDPNVGWLHRSASISLGQVVRGRRQSLYQWHDGRSDELMSRYDTIRYAAFKFGWKLTQASLIYCMEPKDKNRKIRKTKSKNKYA